MLVSSKTRENLELPALLELFGRRARSELALKALRTVETASSAEGLHKRQALLRAYDDYRSRRGDMPWNQDVKLTAQRLDEARHTGWLNGNELLSLRRLLELSQKVRAAIDAARDGWPELASLGARIRDFTEELNKLSVVEETGELADNASPRLHELRGKLEDAKAQARSRGNHFLNGPQGSLLQEKILTLRNGRYTVLVKPGHVAGFPGMFAERSLSGNSAYMEPQNLVGLNNRIAALAEEARNEERAIFKALTAALLARQGAVTAAEEALCQLDLLHCASEWMSAAKWRLPDLKDGCRFQFYELRHPLLGDAAVPIDIACGRRYRVLVITGPNTGGKTVALKTAALAVFLAWCGLPVSCGDGSSVGEIDAIYADIGDEQSLEQNLSTFSSHLTRIVEALHDATPSSLVLLDELGAGTDPQEGAALGIAVLDEFLVRRSLVLATTHHNAVKHYATTTAGVEAACVDFDAASLRPTYRLLTGVPGQSNALTIASRYGMPPAILQRARQLLDEREVDAERLMGELQTKKAELDRAERELAARESELNRERSELSDRRQSLDRQKDDLLLKAERQARLVLDEAEEQARALLRDLQDAAESAGHRVMDDHKKKTKAARLRGAVREATLEAKKIVTATQRPLQVGDTIRIGADGKVVGEIIDLNGKTASVQIGPMKISVALVKLVRAAAPKETVHVAPPRFIRPEGVAGSLMVRGLASDEALPMVARYLDQAMRAGYGEVTIIHGRGEGILRRAVHDLCARLNYVESYRLGNQGEGGYGVTVVRFK